MQIEDPTLAEDPIRFPKITKECGEDPTLAEDPIRFPKITKECGEDPTLAASSSLPAPYTHLTLPTHTIAPPLVLFDSS